MVANNPLIRPDFLGVLSLVPLDFHEYSPKTNISPEKLWLEDYLSF